ncbi:MAG TPA: FecR family protein [Candidatus Cybelea sp.]|nr:FecR family protein [Candidatus Cybelea sp.]
MQRNSVSARAGTCRRIAGLAVLALSMLAATGGAAADDPAVVGSTRKLSPTAGARLNGTERVLALGAEVHCDEQLWTGAKGRIEIALVDGGTVELGENARVVLDDFVLPKDGAASLVLRSVSGALRFVGGAIDHARPGAVRIVTPVATMVVRGTDFFAGPIDGAYGVFVFHGEVQVATSGGSVTLRDGEGTTITRSDAAPGAIKRWAAAKIGRAEKLVGF